MRSPAIVSTSSAVSAQAARMRACAARPVSSATARNGARDRGSSTGKHRGAAIRHQELAARAARFGDTIGIGERDQRAVG